ncbi:EF-P 5-aminopentanol modification-associated protein YfmF [Liquorilactobacillus sicerae]|uniref:EF-P 5-aminopentanol modification-associated protein YfmF n=1 Tax=Liquorilactobacillus sicerae TaxID=1416943 RepID=UPI002480707C|nr:pitrilysin family protein [Liquorilactobacillus sicerae]
MRKQIKPGVFLTVIPMKQFKTVRIAVDFLTELKPQMQTSRLLLANFLETCSNQYPTQQAIARQLAALYGAEFSVSSGRKGQLQVLSFMFESLAEPYNPQKNSLQAGIDFLNQIIFHPLVTGNGFEVKNFEREKLNLKKMLLSVGDNKQLLTYLKLQQTFFSSAAQQEPSFGTLTQLEKITAHSLWQAYRQMLEHDQVEIIVLGDVDFAKAQAAVQTFEFLAKNQRNLPVFYQQELVKKAKHSQLHQPVSQSKLDLGFALPVYYGDQQFSAALLFNAIFGGLPMSRLFLKVREAAGLAYYASSSYDSFRGWLMIQTGIDAKNRAQVIEIILEQLAHLRAGRITDSELTDAKQTLLNNYYSQLDSQSSGLNRALFGSLTHKSWTAVEWKKQLLAVDSAEIAQVAQKAQLQAVTFLEGEKSNENY